MRRYVATAMLLCFVFSCLAHSQGGNSQLGGVVTDPSGALMPGVTITVTNAETSIANTSITNESGSYNFAALQPGAKYNVSASLPGFQRRTVTNLVIGAAVNVRQDFQMQIATTATTVEVSIEANELLTTNSQSVGEVLSTARVRDLPIVGNDVLSLLSVLPGVRGGAGALGTTFAGVGADSINTVRDGLSVSDGRFQSGVFTSTFINPDLVGEIRVILAPVDAEMGRGNGQVIISTRSGTNKYSGTAQWDIRNTALNPNTWGNNNDINAAGAWEPTVPNWSNTHHYTVSYGGPVIRNKTFFFALWDQQLQYQRNIVNANVMTDAARTGIFRYWSGWGSGNAESNTTFSLTAGSTASVDAAGNPLRPQYNPQANATNPQPYTGGLVCFSVFGNVKFGGAPAGAGDCPGGTFVSTGAAWDTLRPVSDPTGYIAKIMGKMPKANNFATGDGLNQVGYRYTRTRNGNSGAAVTIGTDTNTNRKQLNLKIDQNFNSSHKLSANWTRERNDSYNDQPNWPDGLAYFTIRTPQVFTANLTSTLSSSLLNEGRFGLRYSDANIAAPYEEKYYPNKDVVEASKQYTQELNGYLTTFNMGAGAYAFGGNANGVIVQSPGQYNGNVSSLYNYADTFSWTHGKHAFKFGGEYRATVSNGYNNIPQIPFPKITGGAGGNPSTLATAANTPLLPATGTNALLAGPRGNAVNMLYFLAGSVNQAQMLYWIDDSTDVDKGKWEDTKSLGRKFRDTVENEMSFFYKDDWKLTKSLTLNIGLRWDWYGSPYIGSGFSTTSVDRGAGLFGIGRDSTPDLFDNWLRPGKIYLSGYGSAAGTNGLKCTTGTSNGANLPASSCDPSKLTTVEFIGPNTPNPSKSAYPNDMTNFGPAVGFSWNTTLFGENRPTTFRGGYQITYGGSGRLVGGGGLTSSEVILGGAPGPLSAATTNTSDFNLEYLDLTDVAKLVPVRPTNPVVPGGTIDVANGLTGFSAVDPNYVTPYVQNFTFSASTNLSRKLLMDLRYIGTVSRKQQSSVNPNINNILFNKELVDAFEITRAGGNSPLLDQMLAGLNLNNNIVTNPGSVAGTTIAVAYGPIGTCVAQPTGSTVSGLGQEGCAAGSVLQHASAHLRRNTATYGGSIANGSYAALAGALLGNGAGFPTTGAGRLQDLPDIDPLTAGIQTPVAGNRRLLRNGCDRIANGLYNPTVAANTTTNILTRCFAEDYMSINPQLGVGTYVTNGNSSNYHSIQTQFTLRPTAGLSWQGTYTFSKNLGITGTATDPTNRNGDYTFTNNDVSHEFRTNGTFELPLGPNKLLLGNSSGWLARAIERWQTSVIFNWNSGTPADIGGATMMYANGTPDIVGAFPLKQGHVTWDGPNNAAGTAHGGDYFGPRSQFTSIDDPQCTSIVNKTDSMGFNLYTNGSCTLNALTMTDTGQIVFQQALPGKRGTLGQNYMRNAGSWSFDANLSKTFRVSESKSLQVRIDTTNVLNHPTPGGPTLDSQSGNFGQIAAKGNQTRTFQGTLRFQF